jgi:hypothetical protein
MIGFVDDSTSQANAFIMDMQPQAAHLVARMRDDAQLWIQNAPTMSLNMHSLQTMHLFHVVARLVGTSYCRPETEQAPKRSHSNPPTVLTRRWVIIKNPRATRPDNIKC